MNTNELGGERDIIITSTDSATKNLSYGEDSGGKAKGKSGASFYTENARSMYEMVKELKQYASECGRNDNIQKMLEELAPTTLLNSRYWPPVIGWTGVDTSTAMDDSFCLPLPVGQRLRISNENCYREFTGKRKGGVEGYPIFSTYSKNQRGHMKKRNKTLGVNAETIKHDIYKFLNDPMLHYKLYPNFRNQLWATYMGFCEFDILTRLWNDNKKAVKDKMYRDDQLTEYVVKCFINELSVIDDWKFQKPPVDLFGDDEKNIKCIQQILRGYAIVTFMMLTQERVLRVPSPVEFEFGKFRFPTRGLRKTNDPEDCFDILDMSFFSMAVEKGLLSLTGFKSLMFEFIGRRIRSYSDGEPEPSCRIHGDMLVYDYLGECKEGDDYEVSEKVYSYYKRKFNSNEDKFGLFAGDLFWHEPDQIAREVGLKSFYRLAEDYRAEMSNKVLNFQQFKKAKMTTAEV